MSIGCWASCVEAPNNSIPFPFSVSPRLDRIRSHLFSPIIFSGSMRDSTSSEIATVRRTVSHRLGAVETGFGRYVTLGRARIERRSIHSREQHQAAIRLEPSGQGQEHFALVEDVHVLVKYEGMLDIEEAAERGSRRGLSLSLDGLAHLYIDVRHAAAGHRHMHGLDVWDTMLHQF